MDCKTIKFHKFQATGNDFILIDNRNKDFDLLDNMAIANMCSRRFGIGADGLILLEKHDIFDFKMVYYNSDGFVGSMCGNGGRSIVAYAYMLGLITETTTFAASDGIHNAEVISNHNNKFIIKLAMSNVTNVEKLNDDLVLDTGSPHYIQFVTNVNKIDVKTEGAKIRYSKKFPEGINVNFVEILRNSGIFVRTYERGVEDETFSCGTGAVASALAAAIKNENLQQQEMSIFTKGGDLRIFFHIKNDKIITDISLQGAATKVFEGVYEIYK